LKDIFKIVPIHYLIGLLFLIIGVWLIGEIPNWFSVEKDWIQWLTTVGAIPIICILISRRITKKLNRNQNKLYLFSVSMIFLTWILLLYSKAFVIGIVDSLESGRSRILESIAGYTIYQLWLYGGLGIIHAYIGGIFLSKDLEKTRRNQS
jgi:uncharacterized membrane protein SirB2